MDGPLIAGAWRRAALVAAILGLAIFAVLAAITFHGKRTSFDSWAFRVLPPAISPTRAQFLIGFTEPAISVLVLSVTAVLAVSVRRVDLTVLAVIGPAAGTFLASDVAKPAIHRTLFAGTEGSFPSGHETGVACTATVLLVAFGRLPLRRVARCALLALWVIVSAVALTRFYYHYATDTIGAIGLSVAFVLGLTALLDRYWPQRRRVETTRAAPPPRPQPPRPHRSEPRPVPAHRPIPVHRPTPVHRPLPAQRRTAGTDQLTPRV